MSFATLPATQTKRTVFVTVLGWVVIVGSPVLVPISFITCLMFVAGSYGTAHADPLDALMVIGGPPATVVAGIGLLRRWWWSRVYLLVLILAVLAYNVHLIVRGPTQTTSFVSADGVKTTILGSEAGYSLPVMGICILVMAKLLTRRTRAEFRPAAPPALPPPAAEGRL